MEQAVSERCKAFAATRKSDEDRQAYISAFRRALSVIAMVKTEAWQATCSSLSPKSNPKSAYSLLRSVAGSSSKSSSFSNFPNCSSLKESASVFADYLTSYFSISQPKALSSKARGYHFELRRSTHPEDSHLSFCSPFSPTEFLAAASNLSLSTATGPEKVAYPMLKHFPCCGMDFFLHIFNLSWTLHFFLRSGRNLPLFLFIRWETLSTLLPSSGRSLSPPTSQSFLNASYYPVYSSFWTLVPFSLPVRPVSALDGLL